MKVNYFGFKPKKHFLVPFLHLDFTFIMKFFGVSIQSHCIPLPNEVRSEKKFHLEMKLNHFYGESCDSISFHTHDARVKMFALWKLLSILEKILPSQKLFFI